MVHETLSVPSEGTGGGAGPTCACAVQPRLLIAPASAIAHAANLVDSFSFVIACPSSFSRTVLIRFSTVDCATSRAFNGRAIEAKKSGKIQLANLLNKKMRSQLNERPNRVHLLRR